MINVCRIILQALAFGLLVVGSSPVVGQEERPREYVQNDVAVSSTSRLLRFGFQAIDFLLVNDGTNECFFTIAADTATTSHLRLNAGETVTMHLTGVYGASSVALVASPGESTTVRIGAWR
jgi:hypothetical protein